MKKGLTKTHILNYLDDNNLETVDDIFNNKQQIFDYIKAITECDLDALTIEEFNIMMGIGLQLGKQKAFLRSQGVMI